MINETDLAHPIILSQNGHGMLHVCRALIEGRDTVRAVRFDADPEPDYVNVTPDDLPY